MSTQLDLNLNAMVGEMPAVACEGASHGRSPRHGDGDATHYAQVTHRCTGTAREYLEIYPVCEVFAGFIGKDKGVMCTTCGRAFRDRRDWVRIVGPIS